jgi:CheY-like chemotaxis protein
MDGPMRILIVEDNRMNSTFISAVFEPEGHLVTVANTGPKGLAAALQDAFDLIVLDIELPGLRGDAICRQLRAAGVRTAMVALTASAMPDQLEAVGSAGFDEVMTKPVAPKELRALARRYDQRGDRVDGPVPLHAGRGSSGS